ncbi:MAG TPA: hypothetical protein PLS49_08250 [Candidatus Woesebacteria bacterium]|nr:hypothetical protein [Candidatus Woesebacteria bacterium]
MNYNRKDNLTDVATQINNPSSTPSSQPQSQNSSNNNSEPQNLTDNQVIGYDGTVIDLNIGQNNKVNK